MDWIDHLLLRRLLQMLHGSDDQQSPQRLGTMPVPEVPSQSSICSLSGIVALPHWTGGADASRQGQAKGGNCSWGRCCSSCMSQGCSGASMALLGRCLDDRKAVHAPLLARDVQLPLSPCYAALDCGLGTLRYGRRQPDRGGSILIRSIVAGQIDGGIAPRAPAAACGTNRLLLLLAGGCMLPAS